jgi:hypothetical protein
MDAKTKYEMMVKANTHIKTPYKTFENPIKQFLKYYNDHVSDKYELDRTDLYEGQYDAFDFGKDVEEYLMLQDSLLQFETSFDKLWYIKSMYGVYYILSKTGNEKFIVYYTNKGRTLVKSGLFIGKKRINVKDWLKMDFDERQKMYEQLMV